jgi:hypothetical protein
VKGRAGLGNRMLSALTALLYARLSGRRLVVDWSDPTYSDDGSNVFHRLFESRWIDPAIGMPTSDSVAPPAWRGQLHRRVLELERAFSPAGEEDSRRELAIDIRRLDYPEAVAVLWMDVDKVTQLAEQFPVEFDALGVGSGRDEVLRTLLREDLILQPGVRARVDAFKASHFRGRTVGLHVRYTDLRVSLRRMLRILDGLLDREPDLQIFLATDNQRVATIIADAYENVVTLPHWFAEHGRGLHHFGFATNRLELAIDALTDLYLLAECQYLVVDLTSSFAGLAVLLSQAPSEHVFDTSHGRKPHRPNQSLIWRVWLRFGVFTWGLRLFGVWLRLRRGRWLGARAAG